jgi:hypothetical protein
MKKIVIAALVSGVMSTSAFAAGDVNPADADLIFSTDDSQPMELAALSEQEMIETEGAFLEILSGGALGSMLSDRLVGGSILGGLRERLSDRIGSVGETLTGIRQQGQARRALRREFFADRRASIRTYISDRLDLTSSFIRPQ